MKRFGRPESVISRTNRKETLQIGNGMKKEVVKLLEIVKEVATVELRVEVKGRSTGLYKEDCSGPRQPVNPE